MPSKINGITWERLSTGNPKSVILEQMTDEKFQLYDPEGQRKYLTAQERDAFLAAAKHAPREVRTLCLVLAYTRCRISEALALTADRVDLAGSTIIFETPKKRRRGVYRAVPVPPAVNIDPLKRKKSDAGAFKGLLHETTIETLAHLGEHAFDDPAAAGAFVVLFTLANAAAGLEHRLTAFRLIGPKSPEEKDALLKKSIASVSAPDSISAREAMAMEA